MPDTWSEISAKAPKRPRPIVRVAQSKYWWPIWKHTSHSGGKPNNSGEKSQNATNKSVSRRQSGQTDCESFYHPFENNSGEKSQNATNKSVSRRQSGQTDCESGPKQTSFFGIGRLPASLGFLPLVMSECKWIGLAVNKFKELFPWRCMALNVLYYVEKTTKLQKLESSILWCICKLYISARQPSLL